MAIVGIAQELPDSPVGNMELERADFTRRYLVQTDSYDDGPVVVTHALGIPGLFQTYNEPNAPIALQVGAVCKTLEAERVAPNSLYWHVEAHYEWQKQDGNDPTTLDPLVILPLIRLTFQTEEVVTENRFDPQGRKAFVNSCNQPFDPQPTIQKSTAVLTIQRNEDILSPHPATALAYIDRVATDGFFGQPAETARMVGIDVSNETMQLPGGILRFLSVTYTIHFRDTWDIELLDQGSFHLSTDTGEYAQGLTRAFKTDDGEPYFGLLNGQCLPAEQPHFLGPYRVYERLAFGPLNLPQNFLAGR